jgi:hypothetical protein
MSSTTADRLASAQARYEAARARYDAVLARRAAKREAQRTASYRWHVERFWPAGTPLEATMATFPEDTAPVRFTWCGRPAARQLRSSRLGRGVARPWRVFVTLEGGEVAAATCSVPPHWREDLEYLAAGAEWVASAEVERRRPSVRMWWQD